MKCKFLYALLPVVCSVEAFAADTLLCKVNRVSDWAFYGTDKPAAQVSLVNRRQVGKGYKLRCEIRDHKNRPLYELGQSGSVAASDSSALSFTFKTVAPGFYDMRLYNEERFMENTVIAYEPEKIADSVGGSEDFLMFAHKVALERRDVKPQYVMVRNREMSGREKNVYDFSMVSRGDERVAGYIAFPKGKRGLKGMVTLVQQENAQRNPLADFTAPADFVEMVIYLKSHGSGVEVMQNYLTDMLLALDFILQREEVDKSSVYVQGSGYAGACAFVASAMTDVVAGSVASSPDFSLLTETYSGDSIAGKVSAPLLMGVGLQSDAGYLQETFSIFNGVKGVKEYFASPVGEEIERNRWKYIKDIFIKRISE